MPAKFPPFRIDVPGNDSRHDQIDDNQGGSPRGQAGASQSRASVAQRGGFGQQGRDKVYQRARMSGARGSSGNPASRGGFKGEARGGAFTPEARVSEHGGSPQVREREQGNYARRGGFGSSGQGRDNRIAPGSLPNYGPTNPRPNAGNVSGTAYQRIAGRFKRKAMGAKPTGDGGKYGSPPVTSNT